jgi:hypothetical protein
MAIFRDEVQAPSVFFRKPLRAVAGTLARLSIFLD